MAKHVLARHQRLQPGVWKQTVLRNIEACKIQKPKNQANIVLKEGWLLFSGSVTLKYEGRVVGDEWFSHVEIWRKGGWWSVVQSHWNMKEGWLVVSGPVTLKYEGRVVGGQGSSHTEIWRKGGWWSAVQSHCNMKEGWLLVSGPVTLKYEGMVLSGLVTLKYEGRVVGDERFSHTEIWRIGGQWSSHTGYEGRVEKSL